jgi:hypothetical protein
MVHEPPRNARPQVQLNSAFVIDEAIDEVLEGEPRAAEWREMRVALRDRLRDLAARRAELEPGDPRIPDMDVRLAELREQVAALATEEAVTEFVETSLRATLARPRTVADPDEFDGEEW